MQAQAINLLEELSPSAFLASASYLGDQPQSMFLQVYLLVVLVGKEGMVKRVELNAGLLWGSIPPFPTVTTFGFSGLCGMCPLYSPCSSRIHMQNILAPQLYARPSLRPSHSELPLHIEGCTCQAPSCLDRM